MANYVAVDEAVRVAEKLMALLREVMKSRTGFCSMSEPSFLPEDYAHLATLLRKACEPGGDVAALLSNNHNVVLAALEVAAGRKE